MKILDYKDTIMKNLEQENLSTKNKKILLTGSDGFIGSRLKKKFPDAICIDKKSGNDLMVCPLPQADIIYHLAAQAFVEPSWQHPVFTLFNLQMTARLAHTYPNAKIIYANTSASKNSSPYGFSKKSSSEYLKAFHSNVVDLILPNVYGEGSGRVVDIFKGQDEVTIYGDGKQVRDYVYVDDIVDALVKAKDWEAGEYSLGSNKGTTLLQLAKGKKITFESARKEDREVIVPNTTPNWKPKIKVLDYIK
jgi:UDP-glucose 4-epimerase